MLQYVVKRILLMIPTMIAISIIVFTIIQLPPGNYLESYIAELQAQGESVDPQKIAFLREYYGLDKPLVEQYLHWAGGMLKGDFGYSFEFNMPVTKVIGDRMLLTIIVSFVTILFTWCVAFPIGIYSATHQYSWGDYGLSLLGFLGIAMFARPSQREVFRKRVFSGKSMMSVFYGLSNGVPTPQMSPAELAPTTQEQLQWPMFGQYYEQNRKGGEKPDMPQVEELARLYERWRTASDDDERTRVWLAMLSIQADQVYTIGTVTHALQPVVVKDDLRNVPVDGIYSWDPGAYFGMYHVDTFWFDSEGR
jgi:hypothetical protein